MTSIFIRNPGTPKSWITSGDRSWNSVVSPTGSTSVGMYDAVPASHTFGDSTAGSST